MTLWLSKSGLNYRGDLSVVKRIMAFNDSPEILELYQMLLSDEGYEVFIDTFGGNDDLRKVMQHQPHLLILDYIPGRERSGLQLLKQIKSLSTTASIPVIICST